MSSAGSSPATRATLLLFGRFMPNLIFDAEPVTWQELELMVSQAFDEMGYESHRNEEISTVRGKVKVDVHAIKRSNPIPTHVLCECKYWNKPVDQSVIYSFRSICSDIGAHYGLIISKKGFQSGAGDSRQHTNIHLLSFEEFQATFFSEWRSGISMRFVQMSDVLLPLIPMNPNFTDDAILQERFSSVDTFEKYAIFFGSRRFTDYFIHEEKFPAVITDPRGDPRLLKKVTVNSHREYFEIASQGCADARAYFGI
jgi:hypothetical protein